LAEQLHNKNQYTFFWQSKNFNQLRLFIKVHNWGLLDVIDMVNPNAKIRFSSVGGYDHNNSYVEHNIWMHPNKVNEPLSAALQVFKLSKASHAVKSSIGQINIKFTHFSFNDSDGLYFQGTESHSYLIWEVEVPQKMQKSFKKKLLVKIPTLSFIKSKHNSMRCLYILNENGIVAYFPGIDCVNEFQREGLQPLLESFYTLVK
jgi:hypothetical protein